MNKRLSITVELNFPAPIVLRLNGETCDVSAIKTLTRLCGELAVRLAERRVRIRHAINAPQRMVSIDCGDDVHVYGTAAGAALLVMAEFNIMQGAERPQGEQE